MNKLLAAMQLVSMTVVSLAGAQTPPDRTVVTSFMADSSMQVSDMNLDCGITDVDYAFMIESRLIALYGPEFNVGDLDGDGFITGEDVVIAIKDIIRATFGKVTKEGQTVSTEDVLAAAEKVTEQTADADINFDSSIDAEDILVAIIRVGNEVITFDIDNVARQLFDYIGAFQEVGHQHFMADMCASATHYPGISNTWPPKHPPWWVPNHLVGVSQGYQEDHSIQASAAHQSAQSQHGIPPAPHLAHISGSWPPAHFEGSSDTWLPPWTHTWLVSGEAPPGRHAVTLSSTWPPGHTRASSDTWAQHQQSISHDLAVSRTYWPNHDLHSSQNHIWPPGHLQNVTQSWQHQTSLSQSKWPPNHFPGVSDTWGPTHAVGVSVNYPPGHNGIASNTWPGPQPTWPPNHVYSVSQGWGEPAPGGWPVFPPDHNWFATFQQIWNLVPWPLP